MCFYRGSDTSTAQKYGRKQKFVFVKPFPGWRGIGNTGEKRGAGRCSWDGMGAGSLTFPRMQKTPITSKAALINLLAATMHCIMMTPHA
ncbi:hypothetical protein GDO81_029453 [Engystomops pustulosus]|uniref:Uncharacterized protein n=1 Tax=Engystomops pustulosus TaxID=76066 RepID=A0AAV6YDL1_ENGPU|nr:hypothetical protein GDO81_029453 [Engystomops pustulosus]